MKHLCSLLLFWLLAIGCHKKAEPDSNSFYFRCKVDGKDFRPDNCANCKTAKLLGDTVLIIYANNVEGHIGLGAQDHSVSMQTYNLNHHPITSANYDNSFAVGDEFKTDSLRVGTLEIEYLDKASQVIKGRFSFTAYNPQRNTEVKVTEGSFRLNYITY